MIYLSNVYFKYNKEFVLSDVNLSFGESEFTCILGLNGSGKSTLAKLLNALALPTQGVVEVNGINTLNKSQKVKIRQAVGMVFQNPNNQFVSSIVEDDIAFGPINLGLPRFQIAQRVKWALDIVGINDLSKKEVNSLSGGQKQLVAIASALAIKPSYLVLDEATSMLDPISRTRIIDLTKTLQETGLSIIHITQNVNDILSADRVVTLKDGIVLDNLPLDSFFNNSGLLERAGFEPPKLWSILDKLLLSECIEAEKMRMPRTEKEVAEMILC